MIPRRAAAAAALALCGILCAQTPGALVNPLLTSGPDPWVTYRDGSYYFMHTTGNGLTIWKTRHIADLAQRGEEGGVAGARERAVFARRVGAGAALSARQVVHLLRGGCAGPTRRTGSGCWRTMRPIRWRANGG